MFDKLKSKTIIMNLFDNMHGLKGCIRCLTFKNVLLAHFLLAFSVAGSVSAEALPTSYLNGIEQQSRKVAGRVLQRVDNEPVIGANIVVTGTCLLYTSSFWRGFLDAPFPPGV